ncbi:MAG: transcription elongation factor GreA [Flavobacteriales bacterium]|jgi:transcription elongation factor GreA|nr:transcription elongation factor GreA [Flavobacteriales bacterium]
MSTPAYFTEEGLRKLQEDLHRMRTVERPHLSQQIADARDKGDLSENAEYHAAKEEQGLLEARIAKLEQVLANARVVDATQFDDSRVYIHSRVRVKNADNGTQREFTLVAESEADLKAGKISVTSPIGKGLLGREKGEVAEVVTPAGTIRFEILEIAR